MHRVASDVHNSGSTRIERSWLVSRIRANPNQPRRHFDGAALRALAANIQEVGLQQAILVIAVEGDSNHDFELVDGERRWRAHILAGLNEIRIAETFVSSSEEQFVFSVATNFCREDHDPWEIAEAIGRMERMNPPKTIAQIATIFGKSLPWVYQHRSLMKLDPEVVKLMNPSVSEKNRLKYPIALILASVSSPEKQVELAKQICEKGLKTAQARHLIHKATHIEGESPKTKSAQPSRRFDALMSLAETVAGATPSFLDAPGSTFDAMLRSREPEELEILHDTLKQGGEDLLSIGDAVREELDRRKRR